MPVDADADGFRLFCSPGEDTDGLSSSHNRRSVMEQAEYPEEFHRCSLSPNPCYSGKPRTFLNRCSSSQRRSHCCFVLWSNGRGQSRRNECPLNTQFLEAAPVSLTPKMPLRRPYHESKVPFGSPALINSAAPLAAASTIRLTMASAAALCASLGPPVEFSV